MHNLGFMTWHIYIAVIDLLLSVHQKVWNIRMCVCLMSPATSASRWRLKHSRWQQDHEEPPHRGGLIFRTWGQELLRWSWKHKYFIILFKLTFNTNFKHNWCIIIVIHSFYENIISLYTCLYFTMFNWGNNRRSQVCQCTAYVHHFLQRCKTFRGMGSSVPNRLCNMKPSVCYNHLHWAQKPSESKTRQRQRSIFSASAALVEKIHFI